MPDFRPVLFLLMIFMPFVSFAELAVKPFEAIYTLYKGDNEVGEAVLKLISRESAIHWQLETEPKGLYSLLTNKKPYLESIMQSSSTEYKLSSIFISPSRSDEPVEFADFDWQKQQIQIQRREKRKTISLNNSVYDYLSIHWLSAQLTLNSGTKTRFEFYRKGKLLSATLERTTQTHLEIGETTQSTNCYRLNFQNSNRQYEYCYSLKNPLMPLKIVKFKSGKKPSSLVFKKLK